MPIHKGACLLHCVSPVLAQGGLARALDARAEHVLTNKAGQRERPLDTAMFVVVGADGTLIRNRPPN
jgi:hypothetical protein